MSILLPVVAALTVLLIAPSLLFHFDVTPKIGILLFGTAAAVLSPGLLARMVGALMERKQGRWFLGIMLVQLGSLILSTALSVQPQLSFTGSEWRRFGVVTQAGVLLFAVIITGWLALEHRNLARFLRITAVAGIITAAYGIAQYLGWDPLLPAQAYQAGEAEWTIVRPPSTLGHAGYFATFQLYAVFSTLALLHVEQMRLLRWAAAAGGLLGATAIVLSGTRSAILGLCGGAVLLLAWRRPRLRCAPMLATALAVAVLIGFYVSPLGLKLRWRMQWFLEDTSGGARVPLWRDSLRMAGGKLIAGYGPETFANQFPHYQSLELARARPDYYQESPHNVFVDVLVSQGLIGLLAFAAFCVLAILALRGATPECQAVGAGTVAGLLSQQFLCFTVPTALFFYVLAALPVSRHKPGVQTRLPLRWLMPVAAGLALVMTVYAARLAVADGMLARVKSELEGGQIENAAAIYARAQEWQPPGASADLYYSRAMLNASEGQTDPMRRFQCWQYAVGAAVRAAGALENRPNALVNLAAIQSTMNDPNLVERTLRAAVGEAPNWYRPHWLLSRLYTVTGRLPEAEEEAAAAVERNGNHDAAVQQTLNQIRTARGKSK